MMKHFYITTPLYYVNAAPHIGHSYTNVAADALARYHRLNGESVLLLTGTDEHGQKIQQAAAAAGQSPQEFVDGIVKHFRALWALLNIAYDDFIRTTEARHIAAVQQILMRLRDDGKLLRGSYQGWYCTPDETFWTEAELGAGTIGKPLCPSCQRPLEAVKEEGWHLPLRAHQAWLVAFVKSHPDFIRPQSRYNELMSVIEQPLPESLCITRPKSRVGWGIEVPFDPEHVVYVWFDALLNYVTAAGYRGEAEPSDSFKRLWPADVHFIGKDILRHHALYWPIMLHALGFPDEQMPRTIIAHGWWKVGEQKMSKSLGNIVNPVVVIEQVLKGQPYAADIYRYFLLREISFGQDGSFSEEALAKRLGADLANDLGNLVNRTCSMIERYRGGKIPKAPAIEELDGGIAGSRQLADAAMQTGSSVAAAMSAIEFSSALEAVMSLVARANQFVETSAPWKLAKTADCAKQLDLVLGVLAEALRAIAIYLEPFMPSVSQAIWGQLGCRGPRRLEDSSRWGLLPEGQMLGPHPVLFPRLSDAPAKKQ